VLSSAISIVISLKEHKFQFQFSTNTHIELAKIMFFSYIAMVAVSFGTIQYFGVVGFLWTWLAVETLQTVRLVRLNEKLFAHVEKLDTIYITRLASICVIGLFVAFGALAKTSTLPLVAQAAIATLAALAVGTVAWYLFRVKEVYSTMLGRFSKRFA